MTHWKHWFKGVAIAFLALLVAALIVDRAVLYTWSTSVLRQYQRYRFSALEVAARKGAQRTSPSPEQDIAPPLWSKDMVVEPRPRSNPNVLIALEPALARPNLVVVRGYVVSLMYFPPSLAWSTRLWPLRPTTYGYFRPQEHYGYQIDADFTPSFGPPRFTLFRLDGSERRQLPPHTHTPELFP